MKKNINKEEKEPTFVNIILEFKFSYEKKVGKIDFIITIYFLFFVNKIIYISLFPLASVLKLDNFQNSNVSRVFH